MHCPFCGHTETKVIDSRLAGEGRQIRRRRECLECAERFTTFESAELLLPTVVKGDRSREPFDESKLLRRHAEGAGEAPGQPRGHRGRGGAHLPQAAQPRGARNRLARHRRAGHGGAAASGRGRLRALRLRVPQLSGHRGFSHGNRSAAPPPPPPRDQARISCRSCRATQPRRRHRANESPRTTRQGPSATWRGRSRSPRAACTPPIRIRASAACWCATAASSARAGTSAPAKRTPRSRRCARRAPAARGRHRLRHARALQPHRTHAALRRCADRGGHPPRGVLLRRTRIRRWRARASSASRPPASASRSACWQAKRARSTPASSRASNEAGR